MLKSGRAEARRKLKACPTSPKWLLWVILALCIGRLWLMPLPSSFWVDEMGTVFVVHHGASDPTLRAAPQVADSIYYILPALAEKIAGLSEVSYRFFSVLAMAGALLAIAALASRLIGPLAGWIAVFGCLTSRNFDFQAADARPYALGTLILSVALLELVRWLDSGYWRHGLLFTVCAAMLWWVHLIFWPFYLIFLIYGAWRVLNGNIQASRGQIALITGCVVVACVPPLLRAVSLFQSASAHVIVPSPTLRELASEVRLGMVVGAFVLGALLSWLFKHQSVASITGDAAVLILAWWLLDPLILFGISSLSGNSLFVPRYLFLALPGAVLAACVPALVIPVRFRMPMAAVLGLAALLFSGHWSELWPAHQASDWRAASRRLVDWTAGEPVPVICPSPFIEARPPVWAPDYPLSGFLYSHLTVYPMAGRVYPFPFEFPSEAVSFARRLVTGVLPQAGRFAVYGQESQVNHWNSWFAAQPELRAWDSRILGLYGDVELVAFTKPAR